MAIKGGEIDLTLMNERKVIAPLWLFSELAGMNDDELADVELIEEQPMGSMIVAFSEKMQ